MKTADSLESTMIADRIGDEGESHEQNDNKTNDSDVVQAELSTKTTDKTEIICNDNNEPSQEEDNQVRTKSDPDKEYATDEVSPPTPRSRRNKSTYATADLIREKSPPPNCLGVEEGFREITVTVTRKYTTTTKVGILNGKRQVQCNFCKKHMAESRLANHIRLMHSDNNPYEDRANTSSNDRKLKQSPRKEHQKENNRKKSSHTDSASKPYKCEHCGKSYAIKYTWQQHVKTHIEGRPKCPECGGTFATAFGLFRHRVRNHNVEHNFKVFPCPECSKEFFSTSELALHEQRHSAVKEFVCPECQKAFSVKGNLRIHMRTHAKEKLYKCDLCDGSFSHPYSLISHRRIHTNDLPYQCDICNKSK